MLKPKIMGSQGKITKLGEGGFGITELFEFDDGSKCVKKTIKQEALNHPETLHLFGEEVRVLATLNHDRIPKLIGADELNGLPFIIQEYIPGKNVTYPTFLPTRH